MTKIFFNLPVIQQIIKKIIHNIFFWFQYPRPAQQQQQQAYVPEQQARQYQPQQQQVIIGLYFVNRC